MPMPACSKARVPATAKPGLRWSSARSDTGTTWFDSMPATMNVQRSGGTPWARAASTEQTRIAAAWSTFHCDVCHLLYGKAIGRLAGPGVRISSAVIGWRFHASGFWAATALKRAHSPATVAAWSSGDCPSARRRAFSSNP